MSENLSGATLFMHRIIMNTPEGMVTDHVDHNKSNNQKSNLRICTPVENSRNIRSKTGKVVGVNWVKARERWAASIRFEGEPIPLGHYVEFEDAVKARKEGEIKYFGEFRDIFAEYDKNKIDKNIAKKGKEVNPWITENPRNTSGVRGVGRNKNNTKWVAQIQINYKAVYLGAFVNIEDAIKARKDAEEKQFTKYKESKQ